MDVVHKLMSCPYPIMPFEFGSSSFTFIFFVKHEKHFVVPDSLLTKLSCGETRNERKKLDDELMELNRKIAELSSESGEAAMQRLQDEIKDCKDVLKCGVCSDRPKEVCV